MRASSAMFQPAKCNYGTPKQTFNACICAHAFPMRFLTCEHETGHLLLSCCLHEPPVQPGSQLWFQCPLPHRLLGAPACTPSHPGLPESYQHGLAPGGPGSLTGSQQDILRAASLGMVRTIRGTCPEHREVARASIAATRISTCQDYLRVRQHL